MIPAGSELRVLVATKPVDFRKQADTLATSSLTASPSCHNSRLLARRTSSTEDQVHEQRDSYRIRTAVGPDVRANSKCSAK